MDDVQIFCQDCADKKSTSKCKLRLMKSDVFDDDDDVDIARFSCLSYRYLTSVSSASI